MNPTVSEAAAILEARGLLQRERQDHSALVIGHVAELAGRSLPEDLAAFYRERIKSVGEFEATTPVWNERMGWRTRNSSISDLLPAQAIPIFGDGNGNLFGVDLSSGEASPAVYFFDHEEGFETPRYAAGSSIAMFLLLLAEDEAAWREQRPSGWELRIDPDIDKCPRAPPIWRAK